MSSRANPLLRTKPVLLFVAPYFPPACYGGVVKVYLGLLEGLDAYDVVVVSDCFGGSAAEREAYDRAAPSRFGFRVERVSSFEFRMHGGEGSGVGPRGPGRLLALMRFGVRGVREWKQVLARHRPDLIVCGGTYSAGWLMGQAKVPVVNYVHGEELTMRVGPRLLLPVMRFLQMRGLRRAAMNVVVSGYTAGRVRQLARVDAGKIRLLPNALDTQVFRVAGTRDVTRERLQWGTRLTLLTLARLEVRKGIDQALRALAQLHQRGRLPADWLYVIAGKGSEELRLRSLCEQLGLAAHVDFAGYVADGEVPALYEAADIFLQPNREIDGDTEGFGIVFLEASACGVAVIGGQAGGTADAIEEGVSGYRVDGDSVDAIAVAIDRLADDGALRRRLGEQGARRASGFGIEQARTRFEAVLDEALGLDAVKERRVSEETSPVETSVA